MRDRIRQVFFLLYYALAHGTTNSLLAVARAIACAPGAEVQTISPARKLVSRIHGCFLELFWVHLSKVDMGGSSPDSNPWTLDDIEST